MDPGTGQYVASSVTNPVSDLQLMAGDWLGGSPALTEGSVATLAADVTSQYAYVTGGQVQLMSNLSVVDSTGNLNPSNYLAITAGAAQPAAANGTPAYAVRVAAGKTIAGGQITVDGDQAGDEPNVILQGTLVSSQLYFGWGSAVGDVFSGPTGGIQLSDSPYLYINSRGRVKTAPYLNDANNFRYNFLPVTVTDGAQLELELDPSRMLGTPVSGINLLVNSAVFLESQMPATVHPGDTAVVGVAPVPNSHLVLQSTGNITTGGFDPISGGQIPGNFYWPGYVYLGNVAADSNGNALPGTLGLGTITTTGEFNNVLPGDVSGASGIHFITQFPMSLGGNVVTNANAWVNFGSDLLTQAYSSGTLGAGQFFGGTQGPGTVVNYGPLDAANFHSHAPTAAK